MEPVDDEFAVNGMDAPIVDFGDISIPWPQAGDQLFIMGNDGFNNAFLSPSHATWNRYVTGYKLAGDRLVDYLQAGNSEHDFLVFPIVFLYRHYIELRLKWIIYNGNLLFDDVQSILGTHKFDILWPKCKAILMKIWPNQNEEVLELIEQLISEFSAIDPTSMTFRYPTDTQHNSLLPNMDYIDLRHLKDVMDKVASPLEGATDGIYEYLSYKHDMEAEYRNSFGDW